MADGKLEYRKKEIEVEFSKLSKRSDALAEEYKRVREQLTKLKGAHEEIEKLMKPEEKDKEPEPKKKA